MTFFRQIRSLYSQLISFSKKKSSSGIYLVLCTTNTSPVFFCVNDERSINCLNRFKIMFFFNFSFYLHRKNSHFFRKKKVLIIGRQVKIQFNVIYFEPCFSMGLSFYERNEGFTCIGRKKKLKKKR